ncbi:type II toxin-antitoxin system YafO family toxin [Avibacterium avium]|uniref:type II toxin-antitoxin system YafO family toxin n=1 Tax=Avibacterium avium TaxID=751 RepID=UPI003BF8AF0C
MNYFITIHPDVANHFDPIVLEKLPKSLVNFANSGFSDFPYIFGSYGGFERNPQAMQAQIYKIHIALNEQDFASKYWRYRNKPNKRKSDNFLVFNSHWAYPNLLQIIDIISPEAHKKADKLLPMLIDRDEAFHSFNEEELKQLVWFK